MAFLTASAPVDMTDGDFSNITGGTITRQNPFQYFITGADATTFYQFTGGGLTYNGSGDLTGGTITGYRVLDADGNTLLFVSGFSADATDVAAAINSGDASDLFADIFAAGDNTITGSAGDDVLTDSAGHDDIDAGDGNDLIIVTHSGLDTVAAGAGDDTLYMSSDQFGLFYDAGEGYDTVIFDRSSNFVVQLSEQGFESIESLVLTGNATRNIIATQDDTGVDAGATLRIDGSALGPASRLLVLFTGESDGHLDLVGGSGNDRAQGGSVEDSFHLEAGGSDRVTAGVGDDRFYVGGALDASDRLDGEDGTTDALFLDGDYSAGLTFGAHTIAGIEYVFLHAGNTYKLTTRDGNVAAGETLNIVGGLHLDGSEKIIFDGSAETDGSILMVEGTGNDKLTGGAQADHFNMVAGGTDVLNGNGGDDFMVYLNRAFDAAATINGGDGTDTLAIQTDCSAGVVFTATTMTGIEELTLSNMFDYDVTLVDANVANGATLVVDGSSLGHQDTLVFNGSAEADGFFDILGGGGEDTLTGGAKADKLTGGLGADLLTGGAASDTYVYVTVAESTSKNFDTIDGFDGNKDFFDIDVAVAARDTGVVVGALSRPTFDADLEAAVGAGQLGAGNFLIFRPDAGAFAGEEFLVVDQNATAGYQAGEDLVMQLTTFLHPGGLDPTDFI
jgi:Ca2+-binding RTX toxin-like protein